MSDAAHTCEPRRRGRLIAFEGPNEVGKTTVSQTFSQRLAASGGPCEWHAFPGRLQGTLGRHIHDLHHDPKFLGLGQIAPSALQALHIAAHLDAIERTIVPKLAAGVDIVLDRYWWSTIAYGVATGVEQRLLDALVAAELIAWDGLQPTLVVVLERRSQVEGPDGRHFDGVLRREYRRLVQAADGRHPARLIDNNGTVEQTTAEVADLLSRAKTPMGDVA